jgi:hypothetical protein
MIGHTTPPYVAARSGARRALRTALLLATTALSSPALLISGAGVDAADRRQRRRSRYGNVAVEPNAVVNRQSFSVGQGGLG